MILFVRYNLGPGVAVELQEEASVAELKEVVGSQQGVRPDRLRVLFAGRELQSTSTLQGCDLPEQSTIHVLLHSGSSSNHRFLLQEENSLSRLNTSSSGLAEILEESTGQGGGGGEVEGRGGGGAKGVGGVEGGGGVGGGGEGGGGGGVEGGGGGGEGGGVEGGGGGGGGYSRFFVFCKSCKLIRPGKLRVRCRKCHETTMTLSRGPSCWDDVLHPGRIRGVCQSDGCQGNEAEFYMKCASHPTAENDLSVALDLILTNTRRVPCIACTDIMPVVLVFQCPERHVICLDCFHGYCQTRLNDRQFVHHPEIGYSLPCPVGCEESLIKELHHFRILGEDQYGRYLHYGAEECLLTIGGLMCPSPGCGAGLLPSDGSRRVECDTHLGCGFVFCRDCRRSYHQGACQMAPAPPTGEDSQGFLVGGEASLRGRWDQASLLFIQESTKRCPQCSVPVERNGVCMHMQCPRCGAEWCWVCGVAWNRECMGDHWFG
ncbi:E3 ubiquitin-protein ligase parkin [Mugil cephalus]|uniref:E3 ubiquitin-protein ligase parkin n=1 Tax=Mugil cephalus TaxID=48193 RepID=UPI001FB81755|nr:E3 ubiquitin-protein ligase parkin [Mugil cephalus]